MNEPLQSIHPYPLERSFVLKLHRESDLVGGELRGRVVHVASDLRADFVGTAELMSSLQSLIQVSLVLAGPAAAEPAPQAADPGPAPLSPPFPTRSQEQRSS